MFKRNKRTPDTGQPDGRTGGRTLSGTASGAPRWVGWFTDVGRPLSAIVVMVLCAPGERHLAELAGWGSTLSWGMAGLLVMYAGIAAVVATVRPKGAPGKKTAVLGAIVSLMLAMAAQPVSHYFVTGWMSASPRAPFWLVTVVSCVPPFVMGHLLHLAADPGTEKAPDGGQGSPDPAWDAEVLRKAHAARDHAREARNEVPVERFSAASPVASGYDGTDTEGPEDELSWSPDAASWSPDSVDPDMTAVEPSRPAWLYGDPDGQVQGGHEVPLSGYSVDAYPVADSGSTGLSVRLPSGRIVSGIHPDSRTEDGQVFMSGHPDTGRTDGPDMITYAGRDLSGRTDGRTQADTADRTDSGRTPDAGQDMATFIRDTWSLQPDMDRAAMRAAVRRSFPDKKADAIRKAVTRAEEAMGS